MASSRQPPGRLARLVRRRIVGNAAIPAPGARQALVVRWIGVAAEKRRREARRARRARPASDNVIRLAWAETFGRDLSRQPRNAGFPAALLAMPPRTGGFSVSAPV